ncbi:MAG: 3-deoxy-7-phosphoheptulonate synthase [Deltaproteobacteria bacterium]
MKHVTDDLHIGGIRPLIAPGVLIEELPVSEQASTLIWKAREEAAAIIDGSDDRLVAVVGPCSIHDTGAALEYADKLGRVAGELAAELLVIMRVYFEKPRTTVGWKGLINDPALDGSFDINQGLHLARHLLLDLAERGIPAGSEFLDTIIPQYTADLVSWGAIGARTTESQIHRELASGLSMPIGFKNGTDGNTKVAIDAIGVARNAHHFLSVTKQGMSAIVETTGNRQCHAILRGSQEGPNHDGANVDALSAELEAAGLPPRVMIDCSHGNSRKDPARQPAVLRDVAGQVAAGSGQLIGAMIESHLVGGRQDVGNGQDLVYGQSITDACIGWDETVPMLEELAAAVRARRAA